MLAPGALTNPDYRQFSQHGFGTHFAEVAVDLDAQPEVADAVAKAVKDMEFLGARVIPVQISDLDGVLDCMLAIAMSEAAT